MKADLLFINKRRYKQHESYSKGGLRSSS